MRTIAYLRVSKDSQDVKNQRLAILDFARQEHLEIDEFIELSVLATRTPKNANWMCYWSGLNPKTPCSSAN
jgi:DNA invertase Pin-like site-specific DNA recombinase